MDVTRRTFVIGAAAASAAACACTSAALASGDATTAAEDLQAASGSIDVGTAADYPADGITDTWAKSEKFLVVRDGNRLYAPSARCTHKACTLRVKDGAIGCPCHASKFTPQGTPTGGPAKASLFRYGIAASASGQIIVDKSKRFEEGDWENPAAFVTLA